VALIERCVKKNNIGEVSSSSGERAFLRERERETERMAQYGERM